MRQEVELRHGKVVLEIPDDMFGYSEEELVMLKAQLEACFGTLSAVVESFLSVGAPTFVALVALKQLESYIGFAPAFFASDMGELAEKASKEKFSGLDPMLSSKDMPRD